MGHGNFICDYKVGKVYRYHSMNTQIAEMELLN